MAAASRTSARGAYEFVACYHRTEARSTRFCPTRHVQSERTHSDGGYQKERQSRSASGEHHPDFSQHHRRARKHADRAARRGNAWYSHPGGCQDRIDQSRRIRERPHRHTHGRGSRTKGLAAPGRHHRRTDVRQHRRRTGDGGRGSRVSLHLRHAGQGRAREGRASACLRRGGGHHPNGRRARFAGKLLLGGRPADSRSARSIPAESVFQPDEPADSLRIDRT